VQSNKQATLAEESSSSVSSSSLTSAVDGTPAPLSVAKRIHQLEWQSRSVPNLTKGFESSPQRNNATHSGALPTRPTGLSLLANSSDPLSTSTGGNQSSSSIFNSSSSSGSVTGNYVGSGGSPEKESLGSPAQQVHLHGPGQADAGRRTDIESHP
jgi:hypothetical protein